PQSIRQTIAAPSSFRYCFSVYVSTVQPASVSCSAGPVALVVAQSYRVSSSWARLVMSYSGLGSASTVQFAITLPSTSSITCCFPQVEAQLGAGPYKRTRNQSGVYPGTRFGSDQLDFTTTAPGQHSCGLSLV